MSDPVRPRAAARAAADTLLRNLCGQTVMLRLPMPAIPGDLTEQLGLASPSFQDIELAPVCFRKGRAQIREDGAVIWELLVSASRVSSIAGSLNGSESAAARSLFANAHGVLVGGDLMEIETVTSSDVGGLPCVYRLLLRSPTTLT